MPLPAKASTAFVSPWLPPKARQCRWIGAGPVLLSRVLKGPFFSLPNGTQLLVNLCPPRPTTLVSSSIAPVSSEEVIEQELVISDAIYVNILGWGWGCLEGVGKI